MYKLLIFDWDGTIMDSSERIVASMQSATHELGLTIPDAQSIRDIIGLSLERANKQLIPNISDEDNKRLTAAYSRHYRDVNETPTPLYEGVKRSLQSLHEQGFTLAVATGKSRKGVERVLKETNLAPLFSCYKGADETKSKPNPLMLAELLDETGIPIEQAIMIGDTSYDLEMAKNIGMSSIAVSYGMHSVDYLKTFDPLLIVDNFKQIEDWLKTQ